MSNPSTTTAISLEMTPDRFRELGHRAVEIVAARLEALQAREEPARRAVPTDLKEAIFNQPLPLEPSDPLELVERVAREVLPYPLGHINPRFFGWVNSPAAPIGILAEMLAAALNSSVAGGDQAATYVEHATLKWMKALLGYPMDAGALIVSGGSMANLVGLTVMRNVKSQGEMRATGMQAEAQTMVVYTSAQGHSCIEKAVELLGFGHNNLRKIPVDAEFRMDMGQLEAQIKADREQGLRPVCVAASAGTVNTGAIDPLEEIADLCQHEDLWFHIDGAYGGIGILAEQATHLYKGMERADSLAVDQHKWMYLPVECGCALVRDAQQMRDTFSLIPAYLRDDRALPWFSEFGPQQTRGFKALKLWLAIQQIGEQGYRILISRDVALAKTLQQMIRSRRNFELIAAGPLSITCFRYFPQGVHDAEELNVLNKRILELVQREGEVFLTSTELDGIIVLRACIVNFRTTTDDLEVLLKAIERAANQVEAESR